MQATLFAFGFAMPERGVVHIRYKVCKLRLSSSDFNNDSVSGGYAVVRNNQGTKHWSE